jgi:protease YdgD
MIALLSAIATAATVSLTGGAVAEEKTAVSAEDPAPTLPGIGTHDQRIRVDPDAVPWRALGKLQAASLNLRALCTATLVGPSTVVTAAHCVFNRRTQRYFPPGSLHFLIGYNDGRYTGHAVGIKVQIGDGYDPSRPNETIGSDWALVSLDKNLGSPNRILPILSVLPENRDDVMLGGYQKDHPLIVMADTQCHIVGSLVDASGRLLLRHNCDGTNGASGAPLLIYKDGRWHIAAIAVAAEMRIAGGAAAVLDPLRFTIDGSNLSSP